MIDQFVEHDAPGSTTPRLGTPGAGLPEEAAPFEAELSLCTEFSESSPRGAAEETPQEIAAAEEEPVALCDRVRTVWNAMTAAGETPSVRKVYGQIGGSYNEITRLVRALRQEVEDLPTSLHEPPEEPASSAVMAAEQEVREAEGRLHRLHAASAQAQQEVENASAQVRDLERRALIPEEVSEMLKEARRSRWEARQRAEEDLPALVPGCVAAVEDATVTLEGARLEVLRQQYDTVTQGKAALYDAYQGHLVALQDSLMALHDCTVEQRHLASALGIAFPQDRSNPDRLLAWHLYTSLAEVAGLPPVRVSPSVRPMLTERLADADPSTQPLPPETLPALRQAGAPLRLAYRGGQVLSLREYGIERLLPEQRRAQEGTPCWYSAAEVERLRAHPAFTIVFELVEEDVWPKEM